MQERKPDKYYNLKSKFFLKLIRPPLRDITNIVKDETNCENDIIIENENRNMKRDIFSSSNLLPPMNNKVGKNKIR